MATYAHFLMQDFHLSFSRCVTSENKGWNKSFLSTHCSSCAYLSIIKENQQLTTNVTEVSSFTGYELITFDALCLTYVYYKNIT